MLVSNGNLSAFRNAMDLLLSVTHSTCETVAATPELLNQVATLLHETKAGKNLIHVTGMGRSFRAGMTIGELLKDKGFKISYPGKTLARPIQKNDVVFAVSGSGWTQTTLYNVEASILRGAKIVSLVGHERSKLGRLSDIVIKIPGVKEVSKEWSYTLKQLNGASSPLAPLGTVNELSAMLVGIGIALSINSDKIEKDFIQVTKQIVEQGRKVQQKLISDYQPLEKILHVYQNLITNQVAKRPAAFFVGAGIAGIVANMAAMRFQHLGIKVRQTYDWRFRNADDVVTILSGSGETHVVLDYANMAKKAHLKLISITGFSDSQLAQLSDHSLTIKGRNTRVSQFEEEAQNVELFIPTFEFITAIVLDSIVAQLAFDFEIDEAAMRAEHTNVE